MSTPAVFFDRDGVLADIVVDGGRERPPWTLDELRIIDGADGALGALRKAGFLLVAITNQPDIARGHVDTDGVAAINAAVERRLGLTAVYTCPHDTADACDCRKPRPGMLVRAARELDIDMPSSWLVGDRWVDIAAGDAAGLRTILVDRPSSWNPTSAGGPPPTLRPGAVVADVVAAGALILGAVASRAPLAGPG